MCFAGTVVTSWFLIQEVVGWQVWVLSMTNICVTEFSEILGKKLHRIPLRLILAIALQKSEHDNFLFRMSIFISDSNRNCRGIIIPPISLTWMSALKPSVARCHLEHQAWSRQPAIWALATAPLRRLTLSVLFTIVTTSYQITCTVSERSSIKGTRQCKPTRSSSFALQQKHKVWNKESNSFIYVEFVVPK